KIKGIFSGNKPEDILIISAYFQGDSHELPPEALREAVEHSHSNNFKLLVGCDSNAHHISWGSSSTNNRGKSLFEFLISNNFLVVITYGSCVWWPATNNITSKSKLNKLQRLACVGISGAMHSTPT